MLAWNEILKPIGESTINKESFDNWWDRNKSVLAHLHPKVAEQWIYRHWSHSPYCHIEIERVRWRLETWSTENILEDVGSVNREHWKPDFDYRVFHAKEFEPGKSMDQTGTWNYPIVVLECPHGVRTFAGDRPDIRYWLIEGHQRMRYLNALNTRAECASGHEVFVLYLEPEAAP